MFDQHTHAYNVVSFYTGTGHDVMMYTLLKYPMGQVLVYDNKFDTEYTCKKWLKQLPKQKLDDCMSQLMIINQDLEECQWNEDMLLEDLCDAWGTQVELCDVNCIHASLLCQTLSDADWLHKHQSTNGALKTEEAWKDKRMVANVLQVLQQIVKVAPGIAVSVENLKSKVWVNLDCVQETH